jgi:hypothetical protein
LLILHQLIANSLDGLQELAVAALDIAGAFDTVWHKRLVQKCSSMGIDGRLLRWLEDYLRARRQFVCVDGQQSDPQHVQAGVPQGSILGPLLFLIYINDLPDVVQSIPLLFADDCSILQPIRRPADRESKRQSLQDDIHRVLEWSHVNQLKFAAHKTQLMTVSRRKDRKAPAAPLEMDGDPIAEVDNIRLLGLKFSSDGTVKDHILSKAATAGKLLGMLRRQSKCLSEQARYRIYVATIRPILEYASPLFVNAPDGTLRLLDKIQLRASRLFPTQAHRLDTLLVRRDIAGLSQMFRMVTGRAPTALQRHIPLQYLVVRRTTRASESINLRALQVPRSRTEHHKRSFLPYYARTWNTLSDNSVWKETLTNFKKSAVGELRQGSCAT